MLSILLAAPALPLDEAGKYRTLFTMGQAIGPSQTVLWAMREDFIKAHRAALVDFFAPEYDIWSRLQETGDWAPDKGYVPGG